MPAGSSDAYKIIFRYSKRPLIKYKEEGNYGYSEMRKSLPLSFRASTSAYTTASAQRARPPIIHIENATFYRHHPSSGAPDGSANPPMFPNLSLSIASFSSEPQYWCILGPSSSGRTTLLEILRGRHFCSPPTARTFPYLSSEDISLKDRRLRLPGRAIQYVGFNGEGGESGGSGARGAFLSARYESRREGTDFLLLDYLKGQTQLNPDESLYDGRVDDDILARVTKDLQLEALLDMPIANLSNGQTRRARIAKALLGRPEVLLLDEPFSMCRHSRRDRLRSG